MLSYWASFQNSSGLLHRFDTRIYLIPINSVQDSDRCIGAVVGKNPGSALPSQPLRTQLQAISLSGDKLLPTVRSFVTRAYELNGRIPAPGSYIQVLNLFYLCNPVLGNALDQRTIVATDDRCQTETMPFKWVWFVWGDYKPEFSGLKSRFRCIDTHSPFYFDQRQHRIVTRIPGDSDFARHTQGLRGAAVIQHLSSLI